jgi:hypothetical protein
MGNYSGFSRISGISVSTLRKPCDDHAARLDHAFRWLGMPALRKFLLIRRTPLSINFEVQHTSLW